MRKILYNKKNKRLYTMRFDLPIKLLGKNFSHETGDFTRDPTPHIPCQVIESKNDLPEFLVDYIAFDDLDENWWEYVPYETVVNSGAFRIDEILFYRKVKGI